MTKIFPLVIAMIVLSVAGPLAVDWVQGLVMDVNANTVSQMEGILK